MTPSIESRVANTYDVATVDGLTIQNPVGRLVKSTAGNARKYYSYDPLGRVATLWQCMADFCATGIVRGDYGYNLAGGVNSYTGMGVTFTQTFDSANRVSQVTSNFIDPQHPAMLATVDSSVGYYPNGEIRKMTLGNGLTETAAYNNRLQPCRMNVNSTGTYLAQCTDAVPSGNVLDFTYGYNSGSSNNGNLASWSSIGNQTFARSYGYDSLNRLWTLTDSASAQTCKGLSWTYDAWGNRKDQNVTAGTCNSFHALVDSKNHLLGTPYQYDAAGNLFADGTHTYEYDAENHITRVDGGTTATYLYDTNGWRVRKLAGGITIDYAYDPAGNVTGEISTPPGVFTVGYIYLNGKLVGEYKDDTTYFVHKDHLGSTRLITKLDKSACDSLDFLPFGEQLAGGTCTTHKFTGKERDSESGLDNFIARYESSSLGRFMSSDEPFAGWDQHDPQSFNLYSYVENNPLNLVDPDGMIFCRKATEGETKDGVNLVCISDTEFINGGDKYRNQGFKHYNCSCDTAADKAAYEKYISGATTDVTADYFFNFPALFSGVRGVFSLGRLAVDGIADFFAGGAEEEGGVVLGKMNLDGTLRDGALRDGERTLDLPKQPTPKANWAQNSTKLRQAMAENKPIRDASAGVRNSNTGFLRAERNLLENHGWTLKGEYWYPPK
jgi:RHS repeat-associated protein